MPELPQISRCRGSESGQEAPLCLLQDRVRGRGFAVCVARAAVSGAGKTLLQFGPGRLKLAFRALVLRTVHARIFNEDVETMHKGPR